MATEQQHQQNDAKMAEVMEVSLEDAANMAREELLKLKKQVDDGPDGKGYHHHPARESIQFLAARFSHFLGLMAGGTDVPEKLAGKLPDDE